MGDISTLDGTPLKLVDKFTYLGSSVALTEKTKTIQVSRHIYKGKTENIQNQIRLETRWKIDNLG